MAYRPDGSYQTSPERSFSCAICHTEAKKNHDFTYRTNLRLYHGSGAVPHMVMISYQYLPNLLRVKAGTVVTIVNEDAPAHTITDDFADGMDTGRMTSGNSISIRFTVPGEFNFHCSIHPSMRGRIIVQP